MLASFLVAASGIIVLLLGSLHLLYTFRGTRLHPRDAQLMDAMKAASPVITRQTTMWKAWVGFNATHSFGAMLFGAIYAYLALAHDAFLFRSWFLLALGLVVFVAYTVVSRLYFFSVPFRGIVLAMLLYAGGLITAFA